MSQFGTCDSGCSEHRLELVRAAADDWLTEIERGALESIAAFLPLVERLSAGTLAAPPSEADYRSLQQDARVARRSAPATSRHRGEEEAPAEVAITWWCAECGGIDAPEPCLGICVWRRVEWVSRAAYERTRARAVPVLEHERRLRGLVTRLAFVTPRRGESERSWRAFRAEAERIAGALAPPDERTGPARRSPARSASQ